MTFITVIMLSYNYRNFLSSAIESVLFQTFDDFELIIIDDGSRDGSQEIIAYFADHDSRIRPLFNESNQGISKTYNKAIQLAKGDYCANISSDDRWKPDKLQVQIEIIEKYPEAIVWSEGEIINASGEASGKIFTEMHHAAGKRKSGYIFKDLLKNHYIFGSTRIAKTTCLQQFERNERLLYLNDYLQNIELALHYPFYFIPQRLAEYRIHGFNTVTRDIKGYNRDSLYLCWYLLAKYGNRMGPRDVCNVLKYPVKSFYDLIKMNMVALP